MNITIRVATAQLRGKTHEEYARAMRKLIVERYAVSLGVNNIAIVPGEVTEVLFDDKLGMSVEAREIQRLARTITRPANRDNYFD